MIFIDGSELPVINGTGTEDYFNGSWDYKGPVGPAQPYSYLSIGTPFVENAEKVGGRYCSYRWHLGKRPVPFRRWIKVTIEHGHANARSETLYNGVLVPDGTAQDLPGAAQSPGPNTPRLCRRGPRRRAPVALRD